MLIRTKSLPWSKSAHNAPKKVILGANIVPRTTQIALAEFPEVRSYKDHAHQHPTMWELYYVLEGRARYFVGEDIYEVGVGDFIVVPAAMIHYQDVLDAPHKILYWGIATD